MQRIKIIKTRTYKSLIKTTLTEVPFSVFPVEVNAASDAEERLQVKRHAFTLPVHARTREAGT